MLESLAQTLILLANGGYTFLYTPHNVSVYKDLFVVSIVFLVALAEIIIFTLVRVALRKFCNVRTDYGVHMMFKPLTTAMNTPKSDRKGDLSIHEETRPYSEGVEQSPKCDRDSVDIDLELSELGSQEGMPVVEYRNTYIDVYGLGWACFATLYACDTASELPSLSFVFTLLCFLFLQALYMMTGLFRNVQQGLYSESEHHKTLMSRKALTVGTSALCVISFCVLSVALGQNILPRQNSTVYSTFISMILPSTAPILLISVPPCSTPLRLLGECLPFVLTLSISYIMFYIGTKGQLSTVIHEINQMNMTGNLTDIARPSNYLPAYDLEVHFESNQTLHFSASMDTPVDVNNVFMLLLAPIFKVPAVICILANIISRRLLTVTSCLLLILSIRMALINGASFSSHGNTMFVLSFVLSLLAVAINIVKTAFF